MIIRKQRESAIANPIKNWRFLIYFLLTFGILTHPVTVHANNFNQSLNYPIWVEIIGLVAGFGTTFAALPDLIAMLKKRSHRGMNPRMAAITGTFQILWLIYGFLIQAPAVIFWNIFSILTNATTVSAYFYFANLEKNNFK